MSYNVKILADSVNPVGNRLTTFELTYPRFVHAELMTHRLFSRNAASSRAIPTKKLLEKIGTDPVMPKFWGSNKAGMQAGEELSGRELAEAQNEWLAARNDALYAARRLMKIGLHKQIANRVLEPWMFITVIVSATEYDNWFYLRDSEFAQPEIAWVAKEMLDLYDKNKPAVLDEGEWHLPLVNTKDKEHPLYVGAKEAKRKSPVQGRIAISAARCARVSYLTHDGQRDLLADRALHDRLTKSGHWSPFEHPAMALGTSDRSGNFFGFKQYRKFFDTEHYGKAMS